MVQYFVRHRGVKLTGECLPKLPSKLTSTAEVGDSPTETERAGELLAHPPAPTASTR